MKSQRHGKNLSKAEIQGISEFGIWMLVEGIEYFLSYDEYPWFKSATVEQIYKFEFLHGQHLILARSQRGSAYKIVEGARKFSAKSAMIALPA